MDRFPPATTPPDRVEFWDLPAGLPAAAFWRALRARLAKPTARIVLSLRAAPTLDGEALRQIARCALGADQRGARFALCEPTPAVGVLLEITRFDQALAVFADRASAQAAWNGLAASAGTSAADSAADKNHPSGRADQLAGAGLSAAFAASPLAEE